MTSASIDHGILWVDKGSVLKCLPIKKTCKFVVARMPKIPSYTSYGSAKDPCSVRDAPVFETTLCTYLLRYTGSCNIINKMAILLLV